MGKRKTRPSDGFEPTTPEEKLLAISILTIRNLGTNNVLKKTKQDDYFKGFGWHKYALRIYRTTSTLVIQLISVLA